MLHLIAAPQKGCHHLQYVQASFEATNTPLLAAVYCMPNYVHFKGGSSANMMMTLLDLKHVQDQQHNIAAVSSKTSLRQAIKTAATTAAAVPADSNRSPTAHPLPSPPSSNDLGSLDMCCRILQHHATTGTTWPPVAKQQFKASAADPNTLFLAAECGQWLESAGANFAGKPAIAVMLVTPVDVQGEYQLYITALMVDKDGWPTGDAFASPTASESLTTRVCITWQLAAKSVVPEYWYTARPN